MASPAARDGGPPTPPIDWFNLACALEESRGPCRAAAALYQRALHECPTDADAATNLGLICKAFGKVPAARAAHAHAQSVSPPLVPLQAHRLLEDNVPPFGQDGPEEALDAAAQTLRTVLRAHNFSEASARELIDEPRLRDEAPMTGGDYYRLRTRPGLR